MQTAVGETLGFRSVPWTLLLALEARLRIASVFFSCIEERSAPGELWRLVSTAEEVEPYFDHGDVRAPPASNLCTPKRAYLP